MTKPFQSFLFIFFLVTSVFAQKDTLPPLPKPPVKKDSINSRIPTMIENEEINRIYVGCDNLYHMRGMTGRKLVGKMGDRVVPQDKGFFILRVSQPGTYALDIYNDMTGGQAASNAPVTLLEEKVFEAVDMPDPSAAIAGKSCGFITAKELQTSDTLLVKSKKQATNRVLSFKMILVNTKLGRVELESKDNKLTSEMKAALRTAGEGTTVVFEFIKALIRVKGAGVSVTLPSVSFILAD
jgi:hypothetical protein